MTIKNTITTEPKLTEKVKQDIYNAYYNIDGPWAHTSINDLYDFYKSDFITSKIEINEIIHEHKKYGKSPDLNKESKRGSDDMVNSPSHYTNKKFEVIDIIEEFFKDDYHLGNVFKYIARCKLKGNEIQDLKKAEWYLKRRIGVKK